MTQSNLNLLAVETSGYEGSVALATPDFVEERSLAAEGRRNAQTLILEVDQLLKDHQLVPADIDVVAVSIGPGSFTGLRVGVVFAKTFCWANRSQLVAIDTFQALAQQVDSSEQTVTVISDAQRNELFVNEYRWDDSKNIRRATGDVRVETLAALSERSAAEVGVLTGPGLTKHQQTLSAVHRTVPEKHWHPAAGTVAVAGVDAYRRSEFADLNTLEPLYIRRSYAEEKLVSE